MKIVMFYDKNWKLASKESHLHKVEYDLKNREDRMKALGLGDYDYEDCPDAHTPEDVIRSLRYDNVDFIVYNFADDSLEEDFYSLICNEKD